MGSALLEILEGTSGWLVMLVFGLAAAGSIAVALTLADYSEQRNAIYRAGKDAERAEWFADCEAHEPRYRCQHMWELTH